MEVHRTGPSRVQSDHALGRDMGLHPVHNAVCSWCAREITTICQRTNESCYHVECSVLCQPQEKLPEIHEPLKPRAKARLGAKTMASDPALAPSIGAGRPLSNTAIGFNDASRPLSNTAIGINNASRPLSNTSIVIDSASGPLSNTLSTLPNTISIQNNASRPLSNTAIGIHNSSRPLSNTALTPSSASRPLSNAISFPISASRPLSNTAMGIHSSSRPLSNTVSTPSNASRPLSNTISIPNSASRPLSNTGITSPSFAKLSPQNGSSTNLTPMLELEELRVPCILI